MLFSLSNIVFSGTAQYWKKLSAFTQHQSGASISASVAMALINFSGSDLIRLLAQTMVVALGVTNALTNIPCVNDFAMFIGCG